MPLVIAGFLMVFQKRFIWGGLLTLFATALEINANHFQMTYYLLIFLLLLVGYFTYQFLKEKDFKGLGFAFGSLAVAGIFAIGANATNLLATTEYTKFSTRGKGELTFTANGSKVTENTALSRDYITEYSYGIAESFNLVAPRLFGGSNNETLGTESSMYQFMISQGVPAAQAEDYVQGMPTYWGDQPIVAAPAYIGAVVFFLAFLALLIDKRRIKYVFFGGAMIALVLSWGKNLPTVTNFFIDYIPLYDKFRAVSSIQVLLELCFPVLAVMGLQSFFQLDQIQQKKALLQSTLFGVGVMLILFLFKGTFNFSAASDDYFIKNYGPAFVDALKSDRKTMYSADLLRSAFFILIVAGALWLYIKNKFAQNTTIILIGLVMIFDLFLVDKKYVSAKDFVSKREIEVPFQATPVDLQILQDSSNYRVFEINGNLSSARASFFHKSIGGYHAAKPRRMQQLFDYQIAKNNLEPLNFLNVKYLIQTDKEGKEFPIANPEANGNAWFVNQIQLVSTADEEMKALDKLDSKKVAVINSKEFKFRKTAFVKDSLASITLDLYQPNHLKYTSTNTSDGLAVFSEMYYNNGWNAYVDGNKVEHLRANYVLRALPIPAGKHTIEFKFEPKVVKTGSTIALLSSIGMVLLLVAGIYFERKKETQL